VVNIFLIYYQQVGSIKHFPIASRQATFPLGQTEERHVISSCKEKKPAKEKTHSRDICYNVSWKNNNDTIRYICEYLICCYEDIGIPLYHQIPLHWPQPGHSCIALWKLRLTACRSCDSKIPPSPWKPKEL
jgi:hypothetical protein